MPEQSPYAVRQLLAHPFSSPAVKNMPGSDPIPSACSRHHNLQKEIKKASLIDLF